MRYLGSIIRGIVNLAVWPGASTNTTIRPWSPTPFAWWSGPSTITAIGLRPPSAATCWSWSPFAMCMRTRPRSCAPATSIPRNWSFLLEIRSWLSATPTSGPGALGSWAYLSIAPWPGLMHVKSWVGTTLAPWPRSPFRVTSRSRSSATVGLWMHVWRS